jgi:hypothetical protein
MAGLESSNCEIRSAMNRMQSDIGDLSLVASQSNLGVKRFVSWNSHRQADYMFQKRMADIQTIEFFAWKEMTRAHKSSVVANSQTTTLMGGGKGSAQSSTKDMQSLDDAYIGLKTMKDLSSPEKLKTQEIYQQLNRTTSRRQSLLLTPEEASKRARLQRIHRRLNLLNPKQITWLYIRKHLKKGQRHVLWKDFLRIVFGIEASDPGQGIEGSRLIHPYSIFNTCFESICLVLLVSTIFLVPMELSFWSNNDYCTIDATLTYYMMMDVFFMTDLFYRFFVGIMQPGGIYIDSMESVSKAYLRSVDGFWFNVITSVPFGWINFACISIYCDSGAHSPDFIQNVAVPRVLKPIRALKLVRILRATSTWGSLLVRLNLSPVLLRAIKSTCFLVAALHISACGFWRLKLDHNKYDLEYNLLGTRGLSIDDVSGCYVLCLYFMMTIFATGETPREGPTLSKLTPYHII